MLNTASKILKRAAHNRNIRTQRPQHPLPATLRTSITETIYRRKKQAKQLVPLLQEERLKEWKYWALIDNAYPYDAVFQVHHLLILKRLVPESQLTTAEQTELNAIISEIGNNYDCRMVNFSAKQSIQNHHHIHMLTYKEHRSDIRL